MRILHVLPYDLVQPGGVQTHTLALSDALERLGHESRIVAPRYPLRVAFGGTRADLSLDPRDLLQLRAELQRPHDVLHVQEPMLPLLGALSLLHPSEAARVVTLHSAETAAQRAYRWTRPLARRLLSRADAVVFASEVSRRTASPLEVADGVVIPPCIDLAPFSAVTPEPQPNSILFVGRDEPRKGLPVLLRAMQHLPQARLVVAGPVSEASGALADGRTTFLGPVAHDQVAPLLATASCAVFPATGGEALGLVLVEAMAAGVPVVASDIAGYRVASGDGRAALLTPPGDATALAKQISRVLSDDALRDELADAGRRSAARFDARTVAMQHLDLYRSLLRS